MTADPLEVHLVPMRRRHLRQVIQIENEVEATPWSLPLLLGELALTANRYYLVARVQGRVAGYGGLLISLDEAHITKIAVHPAWQRRQIGSRMMVNLVRAASTAGARHLTLEVRVGNEAAIAMYRRFGFGVEGTRKGYYAESKEDAYVMWAHDIDTAAYAEKMAALEATISGSTRDETPAGAR